MSTLVQRRSITRGCKPGFLAGILAASAIVFGPAIYPASAQDGPPRPLDVPFVPTPQAVVDTMLKVAGVNRRDFLIDLGSGDGRIPITAATRFGTRGFGVDLNPVRVKEANENIAKNKVGKLVTIVQGDLFETDIAKATVISMYLLPTVNMKLRPFVLNLKPGTRIVSHDFDMGDWKADKVEKLDYKTVYFWVVPAKVAGKWQVEGGEQKLTLDLQQKFQMVSGKAQIDGKSVDVSGRLKGTEFTFTIDRDGKKQEYKGIVDGGQIKGVNAAWQARKS
mgnify:CR=1 FL=1